MYTNKILAVDDDTLFCNFLKHLLESHGFRVDFVETTEEAKQRLDKEPVDLLLLDVKVPNIGGLELCRWVRESSNTRDLPILMMSVLGSEDDKVRGLEAGADDYLCKPCRTSIILAHTRVVLRRSGRLEPIITTGELTIDIDRYQAKLQNQELDLSSKEFDLLATMARHPGRLLNREFLMLMVWGQGDEQTISKVDKYVQAVRFKLGSFSNCIETVRGLGYRFIPPKIQ